MVLSFVAVDFDGYGYSYNGVANAYAWGDSVRQGLKQDLTEV